MKSRQKAILTLIAVVVLSLVAGVFAYPPLLKKVSDDQFGMPYRFGLDIAGGAQLIYEVDMSTVDPSDRDFVMNGLRDVVEKRVNLFGVSEPRVVTAESEGSHRIIVELAGIRDVSAAIAEIGATPFLDFRTVHEVQLPSDEDDASATPEYAIQYEPTELTGRYINSAQLGFDQTTNEPLVSLEFDKEGAEIFERLTEENLGRQLAVFLDDPEYTNDPAKLVSAPVVQQKIIGGQAQITGRFTIEEARQLVERFNAGALPAAIELISQQTVDATLGAEALSKGLIAGILGTLAVIIFMIVYYGRFGIFASLALLMYVAITIAIFKFIPVTLTLAGIAGFILSIGMAVDANILIFERTNEELERGASKRVAIEEGFNRAWPSIRDSNASTIITTIVLYFFTTSIVQGFALTLLIGVLVSMFSAITITRTMLRVFSRI